MSGGTFLLGVHTGQTSLVLDNNKKRELHDAITEDIDTLGLNAVQIFTHGPRNSIENKLDYEKIKSVSNNLDLCVHSAYSTVGIWKVNNSNKDQASSKTKIAQFKSQMLATKKAGGWCLVVHISKYLPEVIAETMKILKPIAKSTGIKIGLEMVASKADREKTYETPEKLDNLATLLGTNETYYCFVIDTAHIWGAGVDITSYANMKDWLDRLTFKKKLGMFHLNGSSADRGSGKDRHEIPFSDEDKIWHSVTPQNSGLRAVVEYSVANSIPMICEIKRSNEKVVIQSLETIKKLGGVESES